MVWKLNEISKNLSNIDEAELEWLYKRKQKDDSPK